MPEVISSAPHLSKPLVDDTKLEGVVDFVFIVCHDELRPLDHPAERAVLVVVLRLPGFGPGQRR